MATEIAKAYVHIMPSAKGIKGAITKELGGEASAAGKSAGGLFGSSLVGTLGKVVAAAGVGKMFADAIGEAGNLQQSFGGLETIYGDAADAAKGFAAEAAAMGISANEYAEQAVSFGAALKQSYGGDTVAAAEAANEAIKAMADNSAKFGTDIGSVQNAFQGFAKQNYTMLDNLKLGYGGTKSEMERLLKDATALSGIDYDINNLGDVYKAIGVIQEELGVAGVAAKEAETTLTGSFGAMKAAAKNLMGNLALGQDITKELDVLTQSVFTWGKNLLPLIGNVLQGLPTVISTALSGAIGALNLASNNMGGIVQAGIDIVTGIAKAIIGALPYLAEGVIGIVTALGEQLLSTDWSAVASNLLSGIRDSMSLASGEIFGSDQSIVTAVMQSITNGLPQILAGGVQLITNLANGFLQGLPQIITGAGTILTNLVAFILQNVPTILQAGFQLITGLASGIVQNLPAIITAVAQVIARFVATVAQNLPRILQTGIQLLGKLAAGVIQAIPELVGKIPSVIQSVVSAFGQYDWGSIGLNLMKGIANGIVSGATSIIDAAKNAAKSAFDAAKNALGISSPSKLGDWIGEMWDKGIAGGILGNSIEVRKAANEVARELGAATGRAAISANVASRQGGESGSVDRLTYLLERYLPIIAKGLNIDGRTFVSALNVALGMETF